MDCVSPSPSFAAAAGAASPQLCSLGTATLAPAFDPSPCPSVSATTRHRITAGQAAASQEPPSPKTSLIFSFKVVLATPRRCCRLPWTSGLRVLSTTDVSFSPLIPPLGPKQVQALPARISVSSLLSQCVAAPPCQCHPRLALPSLPKQPWLVGALPSSSIPGRAPCQQKVPVPRT